MALDYNVVEEASCVTFTRKDRDNRIITITIDRDTGEVEKSSNLDFASGITSRELKIIKATLDKMEKEKEEKGEPPFTQSITTNEKIENLGYKKSEDNINIIFTKFDDEDNLVNIVINKLENVVYKTYNFMFSEALTRDEVNILLRRYIREDDF